MKLFYTTEELAKEMHSNRQHIDMLRRLGGNYRHEAGQNVHILIQECCRVHKEV